MNSEEPNGNFSLGFDKEIIDDFFAEFNEAHEVIINTLVMLENTPSDADLINALFRSIHSIKSNLHMVGLGRIADIIHVLETTFDDIRHKRSQYDSALSDVFLISMDRIKTAAVSSFNDEGIPFDINELEVAIARINDATDEASRARFVREAIVCLDPSVQVETQKKAQEQAKSDSSAYLANDLAFFKSLAAVLEQRTGYWSGRTERSLDIALAMNAQAGNPVDATQLSAAVYLHDLGMAFFPLALIHKLDDFTPEEHDQIAQHPIDAYLLLRRISVADEWDEAATIVLQHQEWVNGKGYPKGLKGDDIHDGAKILAIVDAYESMTHAQVLHTEVKRPLIRAIMELNHWSDQQFDAAWVAIFNHVIKQKQVVPGKAAP